MMKKNKEDDDDVYDDDVGSKKDKPVNRSISSRLIVTISKLLDAVRDD